MTFESPGNLFYLLLLPLVLGVYVLARHRRETQVRAFSSQGLVVRGTNRRGRFRPQLPIALFIVALALLVVAWARPTATISTLEHQATVIVVIDVSNSMAAADVQPSRIAVAKSAAVAFIGLQPAGVRVGVVAFGPSAVIVQPPTSVHREAVHAVQHLTVGGGTSISSGLLTSLDAIAGKTLKFNRAALGNDDSAEVNIGYYGASSIVLLSDGENTTNQDPVVLARLASGAGVHIQTIGIGTAKGTTVRIGGFTVATALDAATLRSVAAAANGTYHGVGDAGGLSTIAKTIDLHFSLVAHRTEVAALFAALAALVLVLGAGLSLMDSARVV